MYELSGTIKRIGETQVFANDFTKRELVITENSNSSWQNVIGFCFKRSNCSLLDRLSVGDEVKIQFVVDGREWQDPKSGKIRCFNDLTAMKLDIIRYANQPAAAAPAASEEGDMPF